MRRRGGHLACLLVFAAALLTAYPLTAQTLATFDSFAAEQMDPGRWAGMEHAIRYGSPAGGWSNEIESQWTYHPEFSVVNTVFDRRIVGGKLRLHLVTRGGTHDNTMAPGHGRLALRARTLHDFVTRVQARVTVVAAETPPCRSTAESRTRAQLYAAISNVASATGMFATLSLQRSSFGDDAIVAVLSRCLDSACQVAEDLDWVTFSRSWTRRSAHTLTITHRRANARVVFSVAGGGVAAESRTLRYSPPLPEESAGHEFAVGVENSPANCPATGAAASERVGVSIDARFDNVRVNASAVPEP